MKARLGVLGLAIGMVGILAVAATSGTGSATPSAPAAALSAMTVQIEVAVGQFISFPVDSFSTGATNTSAFTGGGGTAGKSDLQPVSVVKPRDADTVALQEFVLTGKHLRKVTLQYSDNGSYVLENVIVVGVESAGNGDRTRDNVTFEAQKVRLVHGAKSYCWDVVAVSKCATG